MTTIPPAQRRKCVSGIEESLQERSEIRNILPASFDLRKARRLAATKRAACKECLQMGKSVQACRKCSQCKSTEHKLCTYSSVERPLNFAPISVMVMKETVPDCSLLKCHWSTHIVRFYWSMGYKFSSFVDIFSTLPVSMSMAIANVNLMLERGKAAVAAGHQMRSHSDDAWTNKIEEKLWLEAELWEADTVHGFLQVTFDPVTMQRRNIVINSRMSAIMGYHKEELLSRYASHDAEMLFPDLDLIALFLDNSRRMLRPATRAAERYYRIRTAAPGGGVQHTLIWSSMTKTFDSLGRLEKGTLVVKAISPNEYDEAVRRYPADCPLFLAGDRRSGARLLAPPPVTDASSPVQSESDPYWDGSMAAAARAHPASPAAAALRRLHCAVESLAIVAATAAGCGEELMRPCSLSPDVVQ